jgi:hypothetical protein
VAYFFDTVRESLRRLIDIQHLRHTITRRRRLVAALLAGLGVLMMISALRAPAPVVSSTTGEALLPGEVAVPVLVRPGSIASALAPGMVIDLIADRPIARQARVIRIPASGFGATSEAVVVVAVPESNGLALASRASSGLSVMIRPTTFD